MINNFQWKDEKYQLLKFPKTSQINMPRREIIFHSSITIHPVLQTKILLSQPQFLTLPLGLSSSNCSSAQNTFPLLVKFYLSLKEQLGWRFLCEALKKQTYKQTNTFSFLVEIRKLHPGAPSPRTKESP